jgi:tetratricopeptide (TPR) repeat protein
VTSAPVTSARFPAWQAWAVFALTFAVFARALGYGFVLWDDPQYIRDNPLVQPHVPWPPDGFLTPTLGYPIPVTMALYRLTAMLFGLAPAAFHAMNLLLHATNAALLFLLLRRTATLPVAWLGTALWALHPLVVEPVTWCTGTKDLLYALGFLLTLHAGLARGRVPPWLLLVALAAMLAKPTAIVLPACLLWTVVALDGKPGLRRPGLPLALLVSGALALAVFGAGLVLARHAGTDGYTTVDDSPSGLRERIAALLQALDLQMRHVFLPRDLLPQYFRVTDLRPGDAPFWRGMVWLTGLGALAWRVLRAEDRRLRWWLGLALLTYAPVSMLLPIRRFTCDSYAYVPLACLAGLAATALEPHLGKRPLQGLAGLLVAALLSLTLLQQPLWRDSLTLWGTNLAANPQRALLIKRYAEALDSAGRHDDAYAFLHKNLANVQRDRAVDGMVLALFADRAPVDEARALYAWTYAHEANQRPDAHRNFCTFVVKNALQLHGDERQNLATALDALRRQSGREGDVPALLALGALAVQQQIWPEAGALFEHAYLLGHDRQYAEAALMAYQNAHLPDAIARMQAALATASPVR